MDVTLLHDSLDRADKPLRLALQSVVETKPPEQDFNFPIGPHFTIVQIVNDLASHKEWAVLAGNTQDHCLSEFIALVHPV
jgi:hypothetical protein